MEAKFEKIRGQVNSKQENQILYAQTLLAIEETIQEQNGQMVPTAYFGAIMTTLQATSPDNEVAGALVYLLNEVLPNLPQAVVRAKFSDVLPVLEKVYEQHSEEQPVVRSIVGCLQELLVNLDAAMWGIPFAKKSYHLLLVLSANASPKARKGAQDAIRYVLSRPPPPTTVHPTAGMTAEFVLRVLQEATKLDQHAAQQILALLKTIVPYWPPNQFAVLCHTLLQLPKFNNIFLTKATFEVFEALFDVQETDIDQDKFAALLRAICDMKPAAIDERLLPTWLLIVSKAFPAYAKMDASQCAAEIAPVFEVIFDDFRQESRCYRQIANCLSHLVEYCITDDMVQRASNGEANGLTQIISAAERGLGVHYQPAWNDVMTVQQALFRRLHRSAAPLMDECVALLGELRLSPAQSYKEQLDKTLGAAIATMGAENFLAILPLNLETPNSTSNIGRAFLLPLLKSYLTNTSLGYFVNVLIPLADRLHEKGQAAANRELALQAKVYETLVNQIWSLAPGFCDLPTDLTAAFNDQVAERFSSLLYTQPELRPTIAQALQLLVQKNETLKNSAATDEDLKKAYGISKSEAAQNIQHMSKFAVNYLAVFFNVYSQIAPAYRGFLDEVIRSYLGIVSAEEVNSTFKKVLGLLSQALQDPNPQKASSDPTALAPMSHTMLDLAVIMIPFLDLESAELLYNGTMTSLLDKKDDPLLQKKGYKVLRHLLSQPVGQQVAASRIAELESKLLQETESCTASARKDRIRTLLGVVSLLPSTDLHFIPAILSEAVLGTKDTSEKTRSFSFSLLIEMGKKMKQGGIIKSSLVEGMEEGVPDATATISEYFTMVTAGLAGTTAHMIAATITSLSRLLFEFKADLSTETVLELLQTMNIFVASTNREIVKAALGYIKVCIVILDSVLIESELGGIIENLLKCSHQTRNQFKPKIRHIFERLIRLFGYERISELVPEEDKKLIANIQKRRLRAKRRKVASEEYQDDDEEMGDASRVSAKKTGAGYHDAYEEVLYGSESELEGSDDETAAQGTSKDSNSKKNKKKKGAADAFIREGDEDNPLDFLDRSALGRITSSKPVQRKTQNLAKDVQYDEEGRLIFKESDSEASDSDDSEEEEDYYMQAQKSADGFVRTARNKIKFKKGVKDDDMADDDDAMDVDQGSTRRKKKGPKYEALGKEYRSKKAKGDVKAKGKADPYAYVPLSKVTKRKGRSKGPKLTFTGKLKR